MWEVITYGGGDYLVQVFSAMQLFFGGPFQSLAQVAGVIGLIAILMAYLGPRPRLDYPYLLRFAVFYGALFVPKADVAIVDRIENPNQQVVQDVPLGLAALAGMTSQIGDRLTTLYESYINAPNNQLYHVNGMVFGSTLLRAVPQVQFMDATFAGDMQEFISHCAFSALATGVITVEQLEKDPDVWATLRGSAPVNRFVTQSWSPHAPVTCQQAAHSATANQSLNARMPDKEKEAESFLGRLLWPKKNPVQATADLQAALPLTALDIAGVNRTSGEILRQAMMINAMGAALEKLPPSEAAGAMASIQAKTAAERSRFNTYMTMGAVSARSVPIMKAVLEALAYALFPVVGLMILLPVGLMAFTNYFVVLMWLQVWPVIYAVLNSIVYWYSTSANQAGTVMPNGLTDWTMWTSPAIISTNSEIVAMAGYLALSIPMISYMLIRGGAMIGSQVASSLMQPAQSSASQAGREMAYGTTSTGVTAVDTLSAYNQTMFQNQHGYRSSYGVNIDGSSSTRMGAFTTDGPYSRSSATDGTTAYNMAHSNYGMALNLTGQTMATVRGESQRQWNAAYEKSGSVIDSDTRATMSALGVNYNNALSRVTQDGARLEKGAQIDVQAANLRDKMDRWERDSGFSMEDKVRLFAGLHSEANAGKMLAILWEGVGKKLVMGKFKGASEGDVAGVGRAIEKEIEQWRKDNGKDPGALSGKDGKGVQQSTGILDRLAIAKGGVEGSILSGLSQMLKNAAAYSEGNSLRSQWGTFERATNDLFQEMSEQDLRKTGLSEIRSNRQQSLEDRNQFQSSLRESQAYSEVEARIATAGGAFEMANIAAFDRYLMSMGVKDPAKFVHQSIVSGDGQALRFAQNFAQERGGQLVKGLIGDRGLSPDAVNQAYLDYQQRLGADSVDARVDMNTRTEGVKQQIAGAGVNPDEARNVAAPKTPMGGVKKAADRVVARAAGKNQSIGADIDRTGRQRVAQVNEKVPGAGSGSNVLGAMTEAFRHLSKGDAYTNAEAPPNNGASRFRPANAAGKPGKGTSGDW